MKRTGRTRETCCWTVHQRVRRRRPGRGRAGAAAGGCSRCSRGGGLQRRRRRRRQRQLSRPGDRNRLFLELRKHDSLRPCRRRARSRAAPVLPDRAPEHNLTPTAADPAAPAAPGNPRPSATGPEWPPPPPPTPTTPHSRSTPDSLSAYLPPPSNSTRGRQWYGGAG